MKELNFGGTQIVLSHVSQGRLQIRVGTLSMEISQEQAAELGNALLKWSLMPGEVDVAQAPLSTQKRDLNPDRICQCPICECNRSTSTWRVLCETCAEAHAWECDSGTCDVVVDDRSELCSQRHCSVHCDEHCSHESENDCKCECGCNNKCGDDPLCQECWGVDGHSGVCKSCNFVGKTCADGYCDTCCDKRDQHKDYAEAAMVVPIINPSLVCKCRCDCSAEVMSDRLLCGRCHDGGYDHQTECAAYGCTKLFSPDEETRDYPDDYCTGCERCKAHCICDRSF